VSSDALSEVLSHFDASGRAYMDGFNRDALSRLDDQEREQIIPLLKDRVRRGDSVSLTALMHLLPPEEMFDFASELLNECSSELLKVQLATAIVEVAPSEAAWQQVIGFVGSIDPWIRSRAINFVMMHPPGEAGRNSLVRAVCTQFAKEGVEKLLLPEIVVLLTSCGYAPRSHELKDAIKLLLGVPQAERSRALGSLGIRADDGSVDQ